MVGTKRPSDSWWRHLISKSRRDPAPSFCFLPLLLTETEGLGMSNAEETGMTMHPVEPTRSAHRYSFGLHIITAALLMVGASSSEAGGMFPFVMPGLEPNRGITDLAWLNDGPAGKDGFVRVKDGHFVDGRGERIRFLGTNFTAASAFPDHQTADKLAARLASLGINAVRFHHLDNRSAPNGLWKAGALKKDQFDPGQLDRLDYFVAALKKHGIYVNLNLHVSRRYWEGAIFPDGLTPDEREARLPKFGKGLDNINAQMIQMQRDYARALLTHVNPYTQSSYANEPSVAFVEINNENSLLQLDVSNLPDYYRQDVLKTWNAWLKARYRSQEKLLKAWEPHRQTGANLLPAQYATVGKRLSATWDDGILRAAIAPGKSLSQQASLLWGALPLENGQDYTLMLSARSLRPRRLQLRANQKTPDWHTVGLNEDIRLGPQWTSFCMAFRAKAVDPGQARLVIVTDAADSGEFQLRDLSLTAGASCGLEAAESLDQGTIAEPRGLMVTARGRDWVRFLMQTEAAYVNGMRDFLKRQLGVRANITDTQADRGGIAGVYRESSSDYVDMHAYWQHPRFPGRAWDSRNWRIDNRPMVAASDFGTFARLAAHRVAEKPFVVSEYDHPAPNQYAAEMFPLIATLGAVQDWDGLFQFNWGRPDWTSGRIDNYFSLQQHPAKLVFLPFAALIFRHGDLPAASGALELQVPTREVETWVAEGLTMNDLWQQAGSRVREWIGYRASARFTQAGRIALARTGDPATQLRWNPRGRLFTLDASRAKAVVGHVAGAPIDLQGVRIEVGGNQRRFAAVALHAADGQPIGESRRLLLAAVGNCENTAMGWNADYSSVGNRWGKAPTMCEGVTVRLSIDTAMTSARVFALDSAGARKAEVPATIERRQLIIQVSPSYQTLWYEIAAGQ